MQLIKNVLKKYFFNTSGPKVIYGGLANGMKINYDLNHRLQHLLGLYEREIYPYLRLGIKKSLTLIDIGANDGYYVLAFLKTGKKVIACEPGYISDELEKNALINGYSPGKDFMMEKRLVGLSKENGYISIEQLVDSSQSPFFFLVDIDGGEFELLKSCGSNFDFSKATWIIETHSEELESQCIRFLKERKYNVTIIKNAWWRFLIPEQRPLEHNRWLFAEYK